MVPLIRVPGTLPQQAVGHLLFDSFIIAGREVIGWMQPQRVDFAFTAELVVPTGEGRGSMNWRWPAGRRLHLLKISRDNTGGGMTKNFIP